MDNAYMVVDYFYHFSKMPFWAHPQGTNGTVLPLYSPHLLPRTMWSLRNHSEYGELHRSLLRNIKPSWAEVPFYKSAPGSRTVRSEEHTSELQSRGHLVCRLLLE